MMAFEILQLNKKVLETMSTASIEVGDVKHIPMIEEYRRLYSEGHKMTYIMTYLSDEYNLSERQVYRVVNRLTKKIEL